MLAHRNWGRAKRCRSIIGSRTRSSQATKPASTTSPAVIDPSVAGSDHPRAGASITP